MRQAIHIFKKDVRHLLYEIVLVLVVVVAFTWFCVPEADGPDPGMLVALLLPLCWAVMIGRLIYAETIPGDRQFWITRPYVGVSLLGAKALFILTFVTLPMVVADLVILRAYGFALAGHVLGLVWNQCLLLAAFALPLMAICSMTTGLGQLFTVLVVFGLVFLTTYASNSWFALDWMLSSYVLTVIVVSSLAILIWQYRARRTASSRLLACGTVVLVVLGTVFFPWNAAYAIQARMSKVKVDPSTIHVGFDLNRKRAAAAVVDQNGHVEITIPLAITGVAEGMEMTPDGLTAVIEAPSGEVSRNEKQPWRQIFTGPRTFTALETTVDGAFYAKVKNQPAKVRGILYLTLNGNRQVVEISLRGQPIQVPGVGICSANTMMGNRFFGCTAVFRSPTVDWSLHFVDFGDEEPTPIKPSPFASYSPFPAEFGIGPVDQLFASADPKHRMTSSATVVTTEPLAHVPVKFEIANLRLGEFEVRPADR
jgi:hypothetical protein